MSLRAIVQWSADWQAAPLVLAALAAAVGLWRIGPRRVPQIRGAIVLGRRRRRPTLRFSRRGHDELTLAGVPLSTLDETKHFKLIGTTGTGKSTAIRGLVQGALDRGDRAVISDPDGGYVRYFHSPRRGDVVLNPFEPISVKWDLFAELMDSFDVELLASALIPSTEDTSAREWRAYARTFFTAITRHCHRTGMRDGRELWRLLLIAPLQELSGVVAGTPAQPFLEAENARMFSSIRSVMASAIAALEFINAQRGRLFSLREWVRAGSGVLFIPYQARQIAALRSIIATWMRLAIFEAMSGNEGDQRLWFIIDELDALGAVDGLKDALARLRKFGGRCVLGFQSLAQVSSTYGACDAQTIIENCSNTLILRCSGSERGGTSQFASRLIGEREIVRRHTSRSRDAEDLFSTFSRRRSSSISEQHVTETAVMASEIEQLPDLCGFLKVASSPAWRRVMF